MKIVIPVQIMYSSDHARLAYLKGIEVLNINYTFLKSSLCCYLKYFMCVT